ncbi:MAG: DNA repair protein [Candidatus Nitrosotenuis sp.]|nr:MAG: DNA repair protein [Candidatus Nitrosotenuis sp.]
MEINLDQTINSGQVFLWKKTGDTWYGVDGQNVFAASQTKAESLEGDRIDFFRKNDNLEKILKDISKDLTIKSAVKKFSGLRLLRQDPFQCYISFIVSSNSSIQNIRSSLYRICEKFGKKTTFRGTKFHLFPEPKRLARASNEELSSCGLGYRVPFVKKAATSVTENEIDFDFLKKSDYQTAKDALLGVFGIGNKVADCILLFSLDKLESFPLDRWILRSLQNYYPGRFSFDGKTLTDKKYQALHSELVQYFGKYAGYSQQFLFKMIRDENQKKWL